MLWSRNVFVPMIRSAFGIGAFVICSSVVTAGVITATNSASGLFDGSSGTRDVIFSGLESGYETGVVTDVNISINFAKADGELFDPPFPGDTPYFEEIRFRLSHSLNTSTLIEADSWGEGAGLFDGTILFDDSAALVVNFSTAPMAGTFRPTGAGDLSVFNGGLAAGTWSLFIEDTLSQDALRFRSFTLDVTTAGIAVPEPSSVALLAVGCIAAYFRIRKRKGDIVLFQ